MVRIKKNALRIRQKVLEKEMIKIQKPQKPVQFLLFLHLLMPDLNAVQHVRFYDSVLALPQNNGSTIRPLKVRSKLAVQY